MKTIIEQREEITDDIKSMKKGSYEQMWLITMYGLGSYFKSLFRFGGSSKVTRDNLNVIKEMFDILKTEREMLNFILRNLDRFDITSTQDVVQMLDDLNDKTIDYYYEVIDDLEDAVDMRDENRAIRPRKDFPTLIQTNSYTNEVKALALNKQAIREFLGYEEEFWTYIKSMDRSDVRVPYEGAKVMSYAIPLYGQTGIVSGLKMYIPEIADLSSALLAIQTYEKAYNIWKCLGKQYIPIDFTFERQEEFEKTYLPKLDEEQLLQKKKIS
jgi:hypothetical protein